MGAVLSTLLDAVKTFISAASLLSALSAEFSLALQRASQPPGLPDPEPTRTYWLEEPPFPKLIDVKSSELPHIADVAIIGSGIAGASVARSLLQERRRRNSKTDERVIVLDARQLSSGATARNGGHIKPASYESFSRFSKLVSKDRAAALTRFQLRHVDCLVNLCQSEGINVAEARKVETVDVFLDAHTFSRSVDAVVELKTWAPEVEIAVWNGHEAQEVWPSSSLLRYLVNMNRGSASTTALLAHCPIRQALSGHTDSPHPFGRVF